jgi:ribosomal protein S18 acetylase RimI-like enzyme
MGSNRKIRTATWNDEPKIGALLALAFATDPFVRWLMPDALDYIQDSQIHARRSSGPAFDNGSAYVIGEIAGAALFLPPNTKINRDLEPGEEKLETALVFPREFPELIEKSAAYCPNEPHWYLSLIVVDPSKRGKGYGSALMTHALGICDRDHLPVYLESTNAANLSL